MGNRLLDTNFQQWPLRLPFIYYSPGPTHMVRVTCFLLTILPWIVAAQTAEECLYGQYVLSNGTCAECKPGTYNWFPNVTECTPCPRDTFTNYFGVVDVSLCRPCPIDAIAPPGSSSCQKCKAGTIGKCGKCRRCPPGSRWVPPVALEDTSHNRCVCRRCPPDSVTADANSNMCKTCPRGMKANSKRTFCVVDNCPPGTEWKISKCVRCPRGSFRPRRGSFCRPCPGTTSQQTAQKPRTTCKKCAPGTFADYIGADGLYTCKRCPVGSTTLAPGKLVCRSLGKSCPENSFEDEDGDCNACRPGWRLNMKTRKCLRCSDLETSFGGNITSCTPCYTGMRRIPGSTFCRCPRGYVTRGVECVACPAGTYEVRRQTCERCPRFTFNAEKASTSGCKPCPAGTSSDSSRGRSCKPLPKCPPGFILPPQYVSYFPRNICASGSTGCPPWLNFSRFVRAALCANNNGKIICPSGYLYDGVDRCLRCLPGSRIIEVPGPRKFQCSFCSGNTYSTGGLSRECKQCPSGQVSMLSYCFESRPPGWQMLQ